MYPPYAGEDFLRIPTRNGDIRNELTVDIWEKILVNSEYYTDFENTNVKLLASNDPHPSKNASAMVRGIVTAISKPRSQFKK